MFARLHKTVTRFYTIVNRFRQTNIQPADLKPLFSSNSLAGLMSELPDISNKDSVDLIHQNEEAFYVYRKMVPYNFASFISNVSLNWVVKANYIEKDRVLEFYVMDASGIYKKYVELDNLVPILYEDFMGMLILNVPFMELIDTDLIYKNGNNSEIFVFDKNGDWNAETANHSDFDFTKLFKETEWIDNQINTGY